MGKTKDKKRKQKGEGLKQKRKHREGDKSRRLQELSLLCQDQQLLLTDMGGQLSGAIECISACHTRTERSRSADGKAVHELTGNFLATLPNTTMVGPEAEA